ncbi:ABC transporter permease [Diplocloster hominis]|uniref:ABC transporter permease n=1 Tax=Diplocloster hominis TaxID=3079010 RepID=UPI0031BAFFF0
MRRVKNKQTIRRLAMRSYKAAGTRNRIAVIAVTLTTLLFTSLFTIGSGAVYSIQRNTVRQSGGDGHAVLKYITDQEYQDIRNHPLIRKISYNRIIADSVDNPEFLKRRVEMYYMDDTGRKLGFCEPTVGRAPEKENEIITDTRTLELLKVPKEIGAAVPLTYTAKGKQYTEEFKLSGYWESDPVFNVGYVIVSKAFQDTHVQMLAYEGNMEQGMAGAINSYLMFGNTFRMEEKLRRIITESGYTTRFEGEQREALSTDIDCNVNWAYEMGEFTNLGTATAILLGCLLILLTGYLIIYNIFQISVLRDVRFYGLLKTIGTTRRQIKKIITMQALRVCLTGIPAGLILGYGAGAAALPLITSSMLAVDASIKPNPVIFAGAALFSLLTVWISTRKPGKIAAGVSPVEASRYTGMKKSRKNKEKERTDGGKLWRMALSNLGRSRSRTILTVISLALSLVLLNSIVTISRGFDMDKYLSHFMKTDGLIAHAQYFNYEYRGEEKDTVSEYTVRAVENRQEFLDGGRIYYDRGILVTVKDPKVQAGDLNYNGMPMENFQIEEGEYYASLYGMDSFNIGKLDVIEGELDEEKLATGRYVIVGVTTDDKGKPALENQHFHTGDQISLNNRGDKREFEVLAVNAIHVYGETTRNSDEYTFILPSDVYREFTGSDEVMSYTFDVKPGKIQSMTEFLADYTGNTEPEMSYETKQSYAGEFREMQYMLLLVGGALSFIIGLIGILNFINSILTSILSRKQEFAILTSIGMTRKQMQKLLACEGLYYAAGTGITALLLGILTSVIVIGQGGGSIWFFSYHFMIWPLLACIPLLFLLGVLVPVLAMRGMVKESVVERLREIE